MSLDAEQAHLPFGDRRAGKRALAVTALTSQVTLNTASSSPGVSTSQTGALAQDLRAFLNWTVVNFQPLPLSVVTLSDDQMAKIKG